MNDQQWHDVEKIGEFAAGSYWLTKEQDPVDSQGRLGGSAIVRNNREYAGVVAGQISVAHLILIPILKLVLVPFWIGSLIAAVGWPFFFIHHHTDFLSDQTVYAVPIGVMFLISLAGLFLWAYLIFWRLTLKPMLRLVAKKGPGITYADGYRGPLGSGETVHIHYTDVR